MAALLLSTNRTEQAAEPDISPRPQVPRGRPSSPGRRLSKPNVPLPIVDWSSVAIENEVIEARSAVAHVSQAMHMLLEHAATVANPSRTGEGRWTWDSAVTDWHGNEVTLLHAGQTQRIDRLVRRRDTGEWWVLDYKSAHRPEEQPGLVEKMNGYRDAVRAANLGAIVRVAFVTGEGRVVEVGPP